jgi:integrase
MTLMTHPVTVRAASTGISRKAWSYERSTRAGDIRHEPTTRLLQQEGTDSAREMEKIIPWVFHRGGKRIKSFRKAWHKAVEAAKIAKRIPHDFRRTAVRNLEPAGVPRSVAMKLT